MTNTPLSARPTSSGLGKCISVLKTTVPEELAEEASKAAREGGYGSVSDWLREVVIVNLRGADWLLNVHANRIGALVQKSATTEPEVTR